MTAVPRPPFRHVAALERDVAVGRSATGHKLPPDYQPHIAALPCSFWIGPSVRGRQDPGLIEGPVNGEVYTPRMLVPTTADVMVEDHVTAVLRGDVVVEARPMRVVESLWRESHREIALELIGAPVPVGGS